MDVQNSGVTSGLSENAVKIFPNLEFSRGLLICISKRKYLLKSNLTIQLINFSNHLI